MQDCTLHKAKHHSLDTTLGDAWIDVPNISIFQLEIVAKCGYLLEAGKPQAEAALTKAGKPHFPAPTDRGGQDATN